MEKRKTYWGFIGCDNQKQANRDMQNVPLHYRSSKHPMQHDIWKLSVNVEPQKQHSVHSFQG